MMKKTHMFAGIAATIPFVTWNNIIIVPIAVIGSFAADWDYYMGIKHRTATHSFLALIISSVVLAFFNIQLGLLWGLNYFTHLLLDSLTVTGVPLLYPMIKKSYGLRIFKTRGAEDFFLMLMLLYTIITMLQ